MSILKNEIKYLVGVGPKRAELMQKELGLEIVKDLVYYFPYKYIDRTRMFKISEVSAELSHIQLKGKILNYSMVQSGRRKRLVAMFSDGTGTIELVWFKGIAWVQKTYPPNTEFIIFGKPNQFGGKINIAHPEIENPLERESDLLSAMQPQYSTTEKLKNGYITSKTIQKLVRNIFTILKSEIPETLPAYLLEKLRLISLHQALYNIHFPADQNMLRKAQYRLKFEELFFLQLNLLRLKVGNLKKYKGFVFDKVGDYLNTFYKEHIPFELTGAQKKVIKEIRKDLGSGKQMNRLLQGDVGSGKTLVAFMSMLIAIDNDFQACIMAPTEILANQHYDTIVEMAKPLGLEVALLTGSTKQSVRKELHENLKNGSTKILIGTHALIEDTVQFSNLGLVVIDEQHRFGVAQRAKLWKKNVSPPHILVMTATPIPRTLAMTVYGDLDVSVIDELPPGRKPIQTQHFYDNNRLKLFGFMKKQIAQGRQIYVVYPLIQGSEKMDYKDLEDGYESLSRAFPPPDYAISILHGKMRPEEKEKSMQLFIRKQTQIMVATTVIEVGVNVPNASVMVIESAERFGLSQLHQLRGRVGRGADQSYCILMTSYKLSNDSRKRIEIMTGSNDGFKIAEEDLKLRGPGDLEGTQQSGMPIDLKLSNLAKDGEIIQFARNIASDILEKDPELQLEENKKLAETLKQMKLKKIDFSIVG